MNRFTRPFRETLLRACCVMACLLPAARAVHAVQKSEAEMQLEFGVKVARMGSWHEAAFRFEKAIRADGGNARAYNNLAVARESLGQFEQAKAAYEKALALDPQDKRIRENYERFMDFFRSIRKGDT